MVIPTVELSPDALDTAAKSLQVGADHHHKLGWRRRRGDGGESREEGGNGGEGTFPLPDRAALPFPCLSELTRHRERPRSQRPVDLSPGDGSDRGHPWRHAHYDCRSASTGAKRKARALPAS